MQPALAPRLSPSYSMSLPQVSRHYSDPSLKRINHHILAESSCAFPLCSIRSSHVSPPIQISHSFSLAANGTHPARSPANHLKQQDRSSEGQSNVFPIPTSPRSR